MVRGRSIVRGRRPKVNGHINTAAFRCVGERPAQEAIGSSDGDLHDPTCTTGDVASNRAAIGPARSGGKGCPPPARNSDRVACTLTTPVLVSASNVQIGLLWHCEIETPANHSWGVNRPSAEPSVKMPSSLSGPGHQLSRIGP